MHKKGIKFAHVVELVKLNFTYNLYHRGKVTKAGPGYDDRLDHRPFQSSSSL